MLEFEYYHFVFSIEIMNPGSNNQLLIKLQGKDLMGCSIMDGLNC